MPGETFKIAIAEDAKPFCVNTPRTILYAYMEPTKSELELLESQGTITKQTEPTDWCAPIVVARKKNSNRIILCVDFSHLNRFVKRERFQSTPPAVAVADICASKARHFHGLRCHQGVSSVPVGQGESVAHYVHYSFWTLQVHA